MADHFQEIYANHADQYEAMVAREDYEGNILKALQNIRPLQGTDVVEFGAGTGRLTLLLAPLVKSIAAFDGSQAMLDVAIGKLQKGGFSNWRAEVADNRALPVADDSADIAVEGWSFGHFQGWYPDSWREEAGKALAEMQRILRPGGTAILLETMGTGRETPQPPHAGLADFYAWLEGEHGFSSTWIRTDYQFESLKEAVELAGFFFGEELAGTIAAKNWVILPECTGVWWLVS
jgi:ubiquinone/menaquinone biosynthesis C-methylase UbiE